MTIPYPRASPAGRLPMVPDGWPIGSYDSYKEAQQTVDHLAGEEFPVQGLTIVGIDPMLDEWACRRPYTSNTNRTAALTDWLHTYNHCESSGGWSGTGRSGLAAVAPA